MKSDHKDLKEHHVDPLSSKAPDVATLKKTTTTARSKTTTQVSPAEQRKTLKESNTPLPLLGVPSFKIPKKTTVPETTIKDNRSLPTQSDLKPSTLKPAPSIIKHSSNVSSTMTVFSKQNVLKDDPQPTPVDSFAPHIDPATWQDQMLVVEELHQARCEKLLEVDVMQSYGELTSMEIDPPEEAAIDTEGVQHPKPNVIIVMDTNILLGDLDYVKKIVSRGLKAVGLAVVLIPWVVLQELDSLKKRRGVSASVAHRVTPAISYI
ncbi:hypothetical protein WMY93_024849 [Mugilogobius chulae]|uniref:PIN domain-containing protein n=1 Tax=Mugilogobius chulae TaxID=88201 RepID=A0AAW0NCT2_9GOBI